MNEGKTALVIGITGGFGKGMTRALLARGWKLRALVRDPALTQMKVPDHENLTLIKGNALNVKDVRKTAQGVDLIVDGFNVPYQHWDPLVTDAARIAADVASDLDILLLFPGNVYNFGPDFSEPLTEDSPKNPPTKKGEIRNRIEEIFEEACEQGARILIVRCGDFFGPGVPVESTWFNVMVDKALVGGPITYPGSRKVPHQWTYMPDVTEAICRLLERAEEFEPFEVFHFGGHVVHPEEMIATLREALGDPKRRVRRFPWWLLKVGRFVAPFLRELLEMRYLFYEPVIMDDSKLRQTLGEVPRTPLGEAVAHTLASMAKERDLDFEPAPSLLVPQERESSADSAPPPP